MACCNYCDIVFFLFPPQIVPEMQSGGGYGES